MRLLPGKADLSVVAAVAGQKDRYTLQDAQKILKSQKLEAGESPATTAAALEFVLEGLHLGKRLNKTPTAAGSRYGR